MGLFGGGFFGSGAKTNQTTTHNYVTNTSIGLSDVEGGAIVGEGNTFISTDQGAIEAGAEIARQSLLLSSDTARDALEAIRDQAAGGFSFADSLTSRSLNFADSALSSVTGASKSFFTDALQFSNAASEREQQTFMDSLTRIGEQANESTSFAKDLFGRSLDAVTGILKAGQDQLGTTVGNLNAIAREQSTSNDERVQAIASQAIKTGAAVAGGVVVVVLIILAMKASK